jgi:hypothetical protein
MLAATLASSILVAQAALGLGGDGRDRDDPPVVVRCGDCGVRLSVVATTIDRLRTSRRDGDREDAAHALRNVKWTCHPEVVHALSESLLRDPDGGVRRESAESLTRLAPSDPEATVALRSAAIGDRNLFVRLQAKKALRTMADRGIADCDVCGPVLPTRPSGVALRVPILGPARRFVPTTEVVGPGVHVVVNPKPPVILKRGPIVSTPIPSGEAPVPSLERAPRIEELPPPVPTPAPSPGPSSPIRPPLPPETGTRLPSERRASAKPVIPPADLPPLEGPRRD